MSIAMRRHTMDEFPELLRPCSSCKGSGCARCCWTGERTNWISLETNPDYEKIKRNKRITVEDIKDMVIMYEMDIDADDIAMAFGITKSWVYTLCRKAIREEQEKQDKLHR